MAVRLRLHLLHGSLVSFPSCPPNFLLALFGPGSQFSVCRFLLSIVSLFKISSIGPVLDPNEFPARYIAHTKGIQPLGHEGGLLAMILVVWAASFGLDERGVPEVSDDVHDGSDQDTPTATTHSMASRRASSNQDSKGRESSSERTRKDRKETTDSMLREVLELIDFHGVMRRPSWDGVRVLLLIIPLLEGMSFCLASTSVNDLDYDRLPPS